MPNVLPRLLTAMSHSVFHLKKESHRPGTVAYWPKPSSWDLIWAPIHVLEPASHTAPCLWNGKAVNILAIVLFKYLILFKE